MPRIELTHRPRGLRIRALDHLRLIQHHKVPGQQLHLLDIAGEHGIGRDDDMNAVKFRPTLMPIEAVQHGDDQMRRELRQFGGPVGDEAGRHHDQRRAIEPTFRLFDDDMGDGLGGLAETHVIGQEAAEAEAAQMLQPIHALLLIRSQGGREGRGDRDILDLDLAAPEVLRIGLDRARILPARGEQILQIQHGGGFAVLQ
jgi:hypothetical protein